MSEHISVEIPMDISWKYASGAHMERFCAALRESKIYGMMCDQCGRTYLPPRPVCGVCHRELTQWVDLADEGTLVAWTIVYVPILDGRTGEPRPSPYGMGLIRLDGADTTLNHFLCKADTSRLKIGARVRAVWRDKAAGSLDDIVHFEVLR